MTDNNELLRVGRQMWPFDWEPLDMGVEQGIVWAVTPGRVGGVNGYILIPAEGHPWSAGFPEHIDPEILELLDVHGGITYEVHPWLGFDTMHAFDKWDPPYDGIVSPFSWETPIVWTVEAVIDEAKRFARQLANITQSHE